MNSEDHRLDHLEEQLTQALVEVIALVEPGRREWDVGARLKGEQGEVYDVDPDVDTGPVVLVRRSDGARFDVDVTVTARPAEDRS